MLLQRELEIWDDEVLIIFSHHVDSREVFLLVVNEIRGGRYRREGRQGLFRFLFLLSGRGVGIPEQPCR